MEKGQTVTSQSWISDDTLFGSNETLSSLLDEAVEPNDPNFQSTRDVFNSPEDLLEEYKALHSNRNKGVSLPQVQLISFLDQTSEGAPFPSDDLEIL